MDSLRHMRVAKAGTALTEVSCQQHEPQFGALCARLDVRLLLLGNVGNVPHLTRHPTRRTEERCDMEQFFLGHVLLRRFGFVALRQCILWTPWVCHIRARRFGRALLCVFSTSDCEAGQAV